MTTIGVLGGRWRASVSRSGCVEPWDGSRVLDWFVAADDRWHVPASEPTTRQQLIENTPVVETRVKVPSGDVVHRVWCVADEGGLTVVEIENESPLPIAVAFSRGDLLSTRPPTGVPIQGIDLPEDAVTFPVGHRSSIRIALRHDRPRAGTLPDRVPTALQVARGWMTIVDRAGRLVVPEEAVASTVARVRSQLALSGPADPADDGAAFLLDVGELVRMGERPAPWTLDVAEAVSSVARRPDSWEALAALDAAAIVLARADEPRALRDLDRLRPTDVHPLPTTPPTSAAESYVLAWHEQRLARRAATGRAELLANGIPSPWLGANFEIYGIPVGPATTVSYAIRWHGDRPAVLWETDGPTIELTSPVIAPQWSTGEAKGEALWPPVATDVGLSFS